MELIRGIENLAVRHRPSVVSIGNYDGVHLGHQHVIKTLLKQSARLGVPATVITFNPLAKEFFMPNSVMRLSSVEQRTDYLFQLGVDQVLCIDFTSDFTDYSPLSFVREVLVEGLGVRHLCVGDDFRFGKERAGDFELLQTEGAKNGFTVMAHDTFELDGERVSSGRIRDALNSDDFVLAHRLLGRPFSISGIISMGQQLGRTLGFPTANIVLDGDMVLLSGVFTVTCQLTDGAVRQGVANLGVRPTVDGSERRLEVHLFDFDEDIYDQKMDVSFHHKIRDEVKFESIDALKTQIKQDAQLARQFFKDNPEILVI